MSMVALRWARGVRGITGAQKCALLLLADMANDEGECWPSVIGLAEDACLSERGARDCLRAIEAAGLMSRVEGGGRHRTTVYRLAVTDPGTRQQLPPKPRTTEHGNPAAGSGYPAGVAPFSAEETRQQVPERGQQVPETRQLAPKRGQQLPPNPHEPLRTPTEPPVIARGARLPDGWRPDDVGAAFARNLGLDVARVTAGFVDYWRGRPGAGGRKCDWAATWRNWCRREADRKPIGRSEPTSKLGWMLNG